MNNESNVSVYGSENSVEDFPVLKAFQQYIDAEQAKARKRMMALCGVFGFIVFVLIAVFAVMFFFLNGQTQELANRNQQLNDKLFTYLTQDHAQKASASSTAADAAIKALTDSMSSLQKQIADQQNAALAAAREEAAKRAAAAPVNQPSPDQLAAVERLRAEQQALAAAKEQLARDRETLHQREVEYHRRRLYPELYAPQSEVVPLERPAKPARRRVVVPEPDVAEDEDIDNENLDEDIEDEDEDVVIPAKKPATVPSAKSAAKGKEGDSDKLAPLPDFKSDKPVEYYKEDDFEIPVEVKGKGKPASKWRIPVK